MKDVTSTSFGYLIAFLLPGIVALYGLGYWSTGVHDYLLLKPGANPEALLGPSLLFVLTALTVGLVVNAIRSWVFETLLCGDAKYAENFFARLGTGDKMLHFRVLVDEHFRYHQFYGGICIALCPMYLGWLRGAHASCVLGLSSGAGFLLLEWRLTVFAMHNYQKFVERANLLVSTESGGEHACSLQGLASTASGAGAAGAPAGTPAAAGPAPAAAEAKVNEGPARP
ncbi:MAG: hypothetical protein WCA13_09500 [Terriglobales bacterium]